VSIQPLTRLLLVAYFLEVGLVLIVVPWSAFWEQNFFAASLPPLRNLIENGFVRGAVSGLGLLTVCAGLAELASLMASRRPAVDAGTPRA
jgi:hypothetical protein